MLISKSKKIKKMRQKIFTLCLIISVCFVGMSCNQNNEKDNSSFEKKPKYIFYFVGDGMSTPQINMAEKAVSEENFITKFNSKTCNKYNISSRKLRLREFSSAGMATTYAENRYITGSAAAATALATGYKTTINTISMNGDRSQKLKTIAEIFHQQGYKIGIISSVGIDNATPACFYAHTEDRNNYEIIDSFLLSSNFEFFGGGFVRHDVFKKMNSQSFVDSLKSRGYSVCFGQEELKNITKETAKVFATVARSRDSVYDGASLPYNIDLSEIGNQDNITLADFVKKSIENLDNDKGFFLFTEGGKIDWAGHANDAVTNVYETIALDAAIGAALDFYYQHPDETLIVFTGDHECGGLTLGYAGTDYDSAFALMGNQNCSAFEFQQKMTVWIKENKSFDFILQQLKLYFGLGTEGCQLSDYELKRLQNAYNESISSTKTIGDEEYHILYGSYEPVTVTACHILNNKSGVDWTSFSHTALPVPVFAIGCNSSIFNGYYDNTDIPKKIALSAGINL